jgi:adenylate kinase
LRAAVKAGTALGRQVEHIMARGALCPDDVVVAIVEDRIALPDARKGFILDGFPRTVAQAEALDRMLATHGLALDGVIELKVNEDALLRRIESRIAEMKARGEARRPDDDPDVLHRRLAAYREQTAPLTAYYRRHGVLHSVDGMAPIAEVARHVEAALGGETKAPAAAVARPPALGKKSKARSKATSGKPVRARRKSHTERRKSRPKTKPKAGAKAGVKAKPKATAKLGKRRR